MSYEQDPLQGGACIDLPPIVIDKYFFADGKTQRFEHLTAKAICGKCAVQAACLLNAITEPIQSDGVRGGESVRSVLQLRHERIHGADPAELVVMALSRQQRMGGITTSAVLGRSLAKGSPRLSVGRRVAAL